MLTTSEYTAKFRRLKQQFAKRTLNVREEGIRRDIAIAEQEHRIIEEKVDARCSYRQYDVTGGETNPATDKQLEYIKQHRDELDSTTLTLLDASRVFLEPEDCCEEDEINCEP